MNPLQEQVCEVCGKSLKSLNLNHLRTHGLITWDAYEEYVLRKRRPDRTLVEDAIEGLLHQGGIAEEHQRRLAAIYSGSDKIIPGVVAQARLKQAKRLQSLFAALDSTETIAFDEAKIAELSFEQLLELMKYASGDAKQILEQLSEATKAAPPGAAGQVIRNQYNIIAQGVATQFDAQVQRLDPRSRTSLMQLADQMFAELQQQNSSKVVEATARHVEDEQPNQQPAAIAS